MIRQDRHIRQYCSEPLSHIENYEEAVNDKQNIWDCHHRLEIQGPFRNSVKLLVKCGMYYHVPASQLIFLRRDEHIRLHHKGSNRSEETKRKISEGKKGTVFSEEHRKKLAQQKRGCKNPNFGKPRSEETKRKIREAALNRRRKSQ